MYALLFNSTKYTSWIVLRGQTPTAAHSQLRTSLKGYLQILFGPGLNLSHLHWLSVLLPSSFTLLSPQVPALIAAPTLQVSLLSHLLCISHTCSLSSSLTRSWSHSPRCNPDRHHKPTSLKPLVLQGCSNVLSRLWTSHNTFFWCGSRGVDGFMDSLALRSVTLAVH